MKKIPDITFGFSDAENYRRRDNKELFAKIFLRTSALDQLSRSDIFFLLGEKGTGKTAYAVFYSDSDYKNTLSIHRYIRETGYQKFIALRDKNNLALSDYTDVWRVIIYLLLSESIYTSASMSEKLFRYPRFRALKEAIDEYYNSAFSPEIATALQFVENSKLAADIMVKHAGLSAGGHASTTTTNKRNDQRFQTHLLTIQRTFQEALSSLRLEENRVLFIDGIDVRPASVPFENYLDCVKGLANAVWSVNNDFFPTIRDSEGRIRVVLLLRPDIFNSLGLQNRNTKIKDNSVVLDWRTIYYSHRTSDLFKMADRMFNAQQDESLPIGASWDHYFPFNATNVRADANYATSFVALMRYSLHRPRDILMILDTLREKYDDPTGTRVFEYKDLFTPDFKRTYGDYLLGEIKDSLSFYYDEEEFEIFLKFFEYLDGQQKFTYEKYETAFAEFTKFLGSQKRATPGFMRSAPEFLQFLYDQNILSYVEHTTSERFIRWCFIERSPSNISPKVKGGLEYEIHYGLANVLNTGKEITTTGRNVLQNIDDKRGRQQQGDDGQRGKGRLRPAESTTVETGLVPIPTDEGALEATSPSALANGVVKIFDSEKKFGFIMMEGRKGDIHFRASALLEGRMIRRGTKVEFVITRGINGRVTAIDVRPIISSRRDSSHNSVVG